MSDISQQPVSIIGCKGDFRDSVFNVITDKHAFGDNLRLVRDSYINPDKFFISFLDDDRIVVSHGILHLFCA